MTYVDGLKDCGFAPEPEPNWRSLYEDIKKKHDTLRAELVLIKREVREIKERASITEMWIEGVLNW